MEPPPIPSPPPQVPPGLMWSSLAAPPVVTVAGSLIAGLLSKNNGGELLLFVPMVVGALILGLSFQFLHAVGKRYRGTSLAFLYCSYLLGQVIICLALWFGSCLLFVR